MLKGLRPCLPAQRSELCDMKTVIGDAGHVGSRLSYAIRTPPTKVEPATHRLYAFCSHQPKRIGIGVRYHCGKIAQSPKGENHAIQDVGQRTRSVFLKPWYTQL